MSKIDTTLAAILPTGVADVVGWVLLFVAIGAYLYWREHNSQKRKNDDPFQR